jgi:hypothetical protein
VTLVIQHDALIIRALVHCKRAVGVLEQQTGPKHMDVAGKRGKRSVRAGRPSIGEPRCVELGEMALHNCVLQNILFLQE